MDILSSVLIAAGLTITDPITSTYPSASGAPFSVVSNIMNPNLNSDMVDGYHASGLLNRSNHTGFQAIETITGLQAALDEKISKVTSYFTDANLITGSGFFHSDQNALNSPIVYPGIIEIKRTEGRRGQIAVDTYGTTGRLFVRSQGLGGVYSTWNEAITTGNQGTLYRGNGLLGGNYTPNLSAAWSVDFGPGALQAAPGNHTHAFSALTDKPNNLLGYGITDAFTKDEVIAGYVPTGRTITINGTTFDLSNNRSWTITAGTPYTAGVGLSLNGTVFSALFGTAADTVAQGNDLRILNGQNAYNRFVSTIELTDLGDNTSTPNPAWNAGTKIFGPSALNRPPVGYGSLITYVGNTTTGDSQGSSWHTQLVFDTGGPFWYRTKLYNYGTPTAWKQVWTSGEFTSANITSWNNAVTAVAGKENSFAKGNLINGTNVTFSGSGTGRLVGTGDLVISVTGLGNVTGGGTVGYFAIWSGIEGTGTGNLSNSVLSYNSTATTLLYTGSNFKLGANGRYTIEYYSGLNFSGFTLGNGDNSNGYTFSRFNDEFSISRFGMDGSGGTSPLLVIGANRSLQLNPGSAAPITTNSQTLNVNFNADLLDGLHAAYLLDRANHTGVFSFTSSFVNDANSIPGSGFYYGDVNTANSPTIYASFLEVNRAAGRRGQLAFDAYNDNGRMWVRTQGLGSSFSQWWQVMTTGTFGTAAGTVAQGNDVRLNNGQSAFDQLASKMPYDRTITINGNTQLINNNPSFTLSGGSGIPTDRTITINGLTKILNDSPVFTVSTGGSGGTVTQVGLAVPTGYYVSSSPITTSGNISFQWSAGYEPLQSAWINTWNQKLDNNLTITINGGSFLLRNNPNLGSFLTPADMYGYVQGSNTITINGNTQNLGGNPNFTISGGSSGMPIDRTITINGNTQYINNNPSFTVSGGGGGVSGSGNIRYLSMFTGDGSNIGNSAVRQIDFFTIWQISIESAGRSRTDLFVDGLIHPKAYSQTERDALTLKYPGSLTYMTGANEGIYYLNNAGTWIKIG